MSYIATDPIADLLTRLRNALSVGKASLSIPHSQMKLRLLKILQEEGYLLEVKTVRGRHPALEVTLRQGEKTSPKTLRDIKKVSKPGRRVYVKAQNIPTVRQGQGIAIVSTPQGLMSGHRAKARKLGGELICEVY